MFAENPYKREKLLDFDQNACAFFLLQMNKNQTTFEFLIVIPPGEPPKSNEELELWFTEQIKAFQNLNDNHIDYWVGITSKEFYQRKGWYFYEVREAAGLYLWLITSNEWEKLMSPPLLFEFMATSAYTCAYQCIGLEFSNEKYDHENKEDKHLTRGCIFDYTQWVQHRRILIANPALCSLCRSKIQKLEMLISHHKKDVSLLNDIDNILSRKWMGTIEIRDLPLYNLKKLYKYDVDRNSGFYKNWTEKFRDSVIDHVPEWTVGTAITGIVTGLLIILGFNP